MVIDYTSKTLREDSLSEFIFTDCELTLINAIHELFSTTSFFLYKWNISKNQIKACKAFPF